MRHEEAPAGKTGASGAVGNHEQRQYTANPWKSDARRCDDDQLARWKRDAEAAGALAFEDSEDPATVHNTRAVAHLMIEAIETEQAKRQRAGFTIPAVDGIIPREILDDLRAQTDIVRLFEQHAGVDLRRAGRAYRGLCPFHDDRHPSLVVWPDDGRWRCFGCGASGDGVTAWQLVYHADFRTAVHDVARFAGVAIPEQRKAAPARPSDAFEYRAGKVVPA